MWVLCVLACSIGADPWADAVVAFQAGTGGAPGYDDPATALGPPAIWSGTGTPDASVVSPFAPAWQPDQLVSLGAGGSLTVRFDEPVRNDPGNVHGVDLVIFGNAGFIDGAYPAGVCAGQFGGDGGRILVSPDGETWHLVPGIQADAPWPTLAWLDAGPYDTTPGTDATDPTRGMNPLVDADEATGLGFDSLVALYEGSAGGVGIDLAPLGLEEIRFVRVEVDGDALLSPEIDAIVDAGPWSTGDVDGNGIVDVNDVLLVIAGWGEANHPGDADHDGIVGVNDLLIVLEQWT